jgi:ABC-2 type transport system permease protein
MTLLGVLRSELIRLRRSPLVPLQLVLALGLGVLAGWYFAATRTWDSLLGTDAFVQLLGAGAPLLAGISCGLSVDADREAGSCINLLGVPSRRLAIGARLISLLLLGIVSAAVATETFAILLTSAGRQLPPLRAMAQSVLGMGVGSVSLYLVFILAALRWGRDASIGLGAIGAGISVVSLGGLANGLVTGTLSGLLGASVAAFVPFAWPARLASLEVELAVAHMGERYAAALPGLVSAKSVVLGACLAVTLAFVALTLVLADRIELGGRHDG